jgi:hypothetical protein
MEENKITDFYNRSKQVENFGFIYNITTDRFEKISEDKKTLCIPCDWVRYENYFYKLLENLKTKKSLSYYKLMSTDFIPYYIEELPEFENAKEIERHPIDIELLKCQAKIKGLVHEMLHLVGIDPSEITFNVSGNNWGITYDGEEIFSCQLEGFIKSVQGEAK